MPFGQRGNRREPASRPERGRELRHLILEFGDDARRDLGTNPRSTRDLPLVLQHHGIGELGRRQCAEYRERDLGANPLHRLERAEPGALMLGGEAVKSDRVLAHMRLDGECHGLADRRQHAQRAGADRHLVAHPGDIDDHRAERDRIQPAGEFADHGSALSRARAPLASSAAQLREWAWVMAMASASAASALSGAARGSRHFTIALTWPLSP